MEIILMVNLFVVQATEKEGENITLLPGIPRNLLSQPNVGNLQQGSVVELLLPSGEKLSRRIVNYYVKVSTTNDSYFIDSSDSSIAIVVSKGLSDYIPIGTIVRLP
jgi:hypothetical protein